jgi:predicted nucleic acid-binding protein
VSRPAQQKYVLDTQLFINAFRDPAANETLQRFHRAFAPYEYLSAIVAQELRAGVKRDQDRNALERHVLAVFARSSRVIVPSVQAWHRSGDLVATMAAQEGLEVAKLSKAFANDVLIALSCRENGCVLVTGNDRDFSRIRKFLQFEFTSPWPGGIEGVGLRR